MPLHVQRDIVLPVVSVCQSVCLSVLGYWHQRADERHDNPPEGNQEPLMLRDKVGRPSGELGVSKCIECDIFPSVL